MQGEMSAQALSASTIFRIEVFRGGSGNKWEVGVDMTVNLSDMHILDCMPNLAVGDENTPPTYAQVVAEKSP